VAHFNLALLLAYLPFPLVPLLDYSVLSCFRFRLLLTQYITVSGLCLYVCEHVEKFHYMDFKRARTKNFGSRNGLSAQRIQLGQWSWWLECRLAM